MLQVAMMCVLLEGPFAGSMPCTPFKTMELCLRAESGLATSVVGASTCDVLERFVASAVNSTAPEMAPLPVPKPLPLGTKSA